MPYYKVLPVTGGSCEKFRVQSLGSIRSPYTTSKGTSGVLEGIGDDQVLGRLM